jgi:hypothetical protein
MGDMDKEFRMTTASRRITLGLLAAAALLLSSCVSVNNLESFDFRGARLASEMAAPPEPRMNVSYDVTMDSRDPFYSALSIMSNVAKASQAGKAEEAMRAALAEVDVPSLVEREATAACARALRVEEMSSVRDADYILSYEIEDWGIDARSYRTAVSLRMHVTVSLHQAWSDSLVWRRSVTVEESASPDMFGLPQVIGTMITTNTLSQMTEEEIARGFTDLSRHIARRVARELGNDLDSARRGW